MPCIERLRRKRRPSRYIEICGNASGGVEKREAPPWGSWRGVVDLEGVDVRKGKLMVEGIGGCMFCASRQDRASHPSEEAAKHRPTCSYTQSISQGELLATVCPLFKKLLPTLVYLNNTDMPILGEIISTSNPPHRGQILPSRAFPQLHLFSHNGRAVKKVRATTCSSHAGNQIRWGMQCNEQVLH